MAVSRSFESRSPPMGRPAYAGSLLFEISSKRPFFSISPKLCNGLTMKSVLFVCIGNICRSPTLEAVCRHLAVEKALDIHTDSCGIGWAHLGERSDPRSFEAARKRGIVIDHRSQQFQEPFFEAYDLILTVDQDILEQLKQRSPSHAHKLFLVTHFSKKYQGESIPDPYYMGESGFEKVLDMSFDCCEGLFSFFNKN
jgi:protein-tyrosine phosphatase